MKWLKWNWPSGALALAAFVCLAIGASSAFAQSTVFGGLWRVFIGSEEQTGVAELELPAGSTCTSGRCTVAGGSGGGHVIQDETVDLPQTGILRFTGNGATVTTIDAGATVDSGSATVVTIPGGYETFGVVDAGSYAQRGAWYLVPGTGVSITAADSAGDNTTYATIALAGAQRATVDTTNGTATNIGTALTIPSGQLCDVEATFSARLTTHNGTINVYRRYFTFENNAGTVQADVSGVYNDTENAALTAAGIPAPVISGSTVQYQVTGIAGQNLSWRVLLRQDCI
jgi:hypothetical protein